MISRETIEEILYRTDIQTLIGGHVNLKRAGSNLKGLCPFHSEKSPSFTVYPADNSFYCFGCGVGGDAISFVMKMENVDYPDAVQILAKRAGITVIDDNKDKYSNGPKIDKERIYKMNVDAAKYFNAQLFKDDPDSRAALEYFTKERRLSLSTIKHFGLGFAPNSYDAFSKYMLSRGYTYDELVAGFLAGKSERGTYYETFRNRVMFPIIDVSGNVIAFGGRVMDDSKPKYLNTSDTPAFKKSRHLFALNFAKNHAAEQMILCEGYMDVIALHAAGFENAVATLGTAITSEQARIFAKYTKKVIITYDSDNAGQTAADKAMRLLSEAGVDVRVLKLSGAKDPDEYIKKFGTDSFRKVISESKSGFEFKMDKVLAAHDVSIAEEKIKAATEICSLIAGYYSGVEREIYILSAAKALGLSRDVIFSDVERIRRKMSAEAARRRSQEAIMTAKNLDNRVNRDAAKNIRANAAEEALIGMMLIFDDLRSAVASGEADVTEEDFSTDFGRRAFAVICELERSEYGFSKAALGQSFGVDEMGKLEQIEQNRRSYTRNDRQVLDEYIRNLKDEKLAAENRDDLDFILNRKRNKILEEKNKKI